MTKRLIAGGALATLLLLSACGSSSSQGLIDSGSPAPTSAPASSEAAPGDITALTAEQVEVTGGFGETPTVTFPIPSQASSLSGRAVVKGTGAEVKADSTVTVNYVGVGALTGTTFDSSFTRGQPATFPLANLIPGWQQGLPGATVGSRVVLVIPGDLAYGPNPGSPDIQPNETLVFVLDIIDVK